MGCDIHGFIEAKKDGKWVKVDGSFYDHRNYGVFGFLANVRNYSEAKPLQEKRGFPEDTCGAEEKQNYEDDYYHNAGWLLAKELLDFDYDQKFYDMRVTRDGNGAARARSLDEAEHISYREFLGESFIEAVKQLKQYGDPEDVRIVFWFDN